MGQSSSESTLPTLPEQRRQSVFVGRQREMAELRAALHDALSGHGRFVMLAGEPGIDKTRTAQEVAAYAEEQGAKVLWGWCYEGEGAPPYWLWVQPIRTYVQQQEPELLLSQMGPGAADIVEIVPELRDKLPDLKPPPSLEPEQARFRLFRLDHLLPQERCSSASYGNRAGRPPLGRPVVPAAVAVPGPADG